MALQADGALPAGAGRRRAFAAKIAGSSVLPQARQINQRTGTYKRSSVVSFSK
jgi:hypothetical protein